MFWALDLDDFAALQSEEGAFPLARAVRSLLASDETFPVFTPPAVPDSKVGVECQRVRWVVVWVVVGVFE